MIVTVTMMCTRQGRTSTKTVEVQGNRHFFIVGTEMCEREIRENGKPDKLAFYVSTQRQFEKQPTRVAIHEIM